MEADNALLGGEQRVVLTQAHTRPWVKLRSPHKNISDCPQGQLTPQNNASS